MIPSQESHEITILKFLVLESKDNITDECRFTIMFCSVTVYLNRIKKKVKTDLSFYAFYMLNFTWFPTRDRKKKTLLFIWKWMKVQIFQMKHWTCWQNKSWFTSATSCDYIINSDDLNPPAFILTFFICL